MTRALRGAAIPLTVVLLWEALSRAGALPLDSLSRPSLIAAAGLRGVADGSILLATWQTLEAGAAGLVSAVGFGVLGGMILGLSPRIDRVVGPTVDALRPVPAVALIPLSLLMFGFGLRMEAAVVAFACVWPIRLVTASAVRGIEPRLLEVARSLEMSYGAQLRKIVFPAALGRIIVGVRIAVGIALIVAVTVEIVLNPRGLGYGMMAAQQSMHPDLMYAELGWLGVLGWLLNALLTRAVRRWPGALPQGQS